MGNKGICVLAIDDNPDNLMTVEALIEEAFPDARILTETEGYIGIAVAAQENPDVILLDVLMPGMDGFEVCRRLKSDERLREIPVVFVTATKGDSKNRIYALECGAEAFLSKPIDESELIAQVRAMVKIKTANDEKRTEKQRLAVLVEEKTSELRKENAKKIKLYESLMRENEARKESEKALLEAKEYFEQVFNTSPDAAFILRLADRMIINVNDGFVSMLGYEKEEAINRVFHYFERSKDELYQNRIINMLEKEGVCEGMEVSLRKKCGDLITGLLSAKQIVLKGEPHISCNIRDITERKVMEDYLEYLSYHDHLTGLYNRRYFEKEVRRLDVPENLPLSIVVGDINGVKLINDAFGHEKGDILIIETAKTINCCSRRGDVLARTGGDEFALIMPKTDGVATLEVVENIHEASKRHNERTRNEAFHINVSLGYSIKVSMDEDINEVMQIADKYMYQRKLLEHKSIHNAVIASIRVTLFEKSEETEEHCQRLIDMSKKIGEILKVSQRQLDELELLASLHDIGKIGIDDRILNKPGRLNDEEWIEMKKHPEIGHRIAMSSPELSPIAEYILYHHERWDGTGYPQSLKGEQIPLLSRIISIADAYDAMTSDRPYRKRMREEDAVAEILRNSGTQFDPKLTNIFICEVLHACTPSELNS